MATSFSPHCWPSKCQLWIGIIAITQCRPWTRSVNNWYVHDYRKSFIVHFIFNRIQLNQVCVGNTQKRTRSTKDTRYVREGASEVICNWNIKSTFSCYVDWCMCVKNVAICKLLKNFASQIVLWTRMTFVLKNS